MANISILDAFERMWQHVLVAVGKKADTTHSHDDVYYTESEIDTKLLEVNDSLSTFVKTVNGESPDENGNVQISVGTEQMQADWNQNDETASDYIRNRTHYETLGETILDGMFCDESDEHYVRTGEGAYWTYETCPVAPQETIYVKLWRLGEETEGNAEEVAVIINENYEFSVSAHIAFSTNDKLYTFRFSDGKLYRVTSHGSWMDIGIKLNKAGTIVKIDPKYLPDEVVTKQYFENNIPVGIASITIEEVGTVLISFTIDDGEITAYQAEDGMTWRDWCDSDYNTNGRWFVNDDGDIEDGWSTYVDIDGAGLCADQVIKAMDYGTYA